MTKEEAWRRVKGYLYDGLSGEEADEIITALLPVTPQTKMVCCKECKFFEYNSAAEVNGLSVIVAHEICKRWGGGCKTNENGYCHLFEPKEGESNNEKI